MLVELALILSCVPVLACATYLFVFTLLSARPRAPVGGPPRTRFVVVVPAHDERANIAATVESLRAVDYPEDKRRILVVADNCTDDTAELARAAGAEVLERHDAERRGKGFALALAFEHVLAQESVDALVVVDADTRVSANLLRALGVRLEADAPAVQAEHAVDNRTSSWRTRLMAIAFALFHDLRSIARERLRLSCGLRGNGMAFSAATLRAVPYTAFSLVEDVEYGIRLGLAGRRVWYAGEAQVCSEMVTAERAARSQRRRWEEGRRQLARSATTKLLWHGLVRRDRVLVDLGVDLLVPPLSFVVLMALLGTIASAVAWSFGRASIVLVAAWSACVGMVVVYVGRGVLLSGAGLRGFLDLATAPAYVFWKLAVRWRSPKSDAWIRTSREAERSR